MSHRAWKPPKRKILLFHFLFCRQKKKLIAFLELRNNFSDDLREMFLSQQRAVAQLRLRPAVMLVQSYSADPRDKERQLFTRNLLHHKRKRKENCNKMKCWGLRDSELYEVTTMKFYKLSLTQQWSFILCSQRSFLLLRTFCFCCSHPFVNITTSTVVYRLEANSKMFPT